MKKVIVLVALIMVSVGCSKKGDDRLEERAEVEAQGEINAEEQRVAKMVKDLKQQALFYESLYGEFEGNLEVGNQLFKLRINFTPNVPIYISDDRSLTVSEVEDYLINQSFNIHLLSWDPSNNLSASGCQVEGVKPNLSSGEIYVSSEECSNLYLIAINDSLVNSQQGYMDRYKAAVSGISSELSEKILNGETEVVDEIVGQMYPTTTSAIYSFSLKRVKK